MLRSTPSRATWIEVWSRRSRLRSATGGSKPNAAKTVPVVALDDDDDDLASPIQTPPHVDNPDQVDNAAAESSSKRPREEEDDGAAGRSSKRPSEVHPMPIIQTPPHVDNPDPPSPIHEETIIQKTSPQVDNAAAESSSKGPRQEEDDDAAGRSSKRPREVPEKYNSYTDPDYGLFLDHLKVDGKSYRLEMTIGDSRLSLCLKYEEEAATTCNSPPPLPCWANGWNKTKSDEAMNELDIPKPEVFEADDDDVSMADEDYRFFLDHVRECNGVMILELDNNVTIRYEEKEEDDASVSQEEDSSPEKVHVKIEDFEVESYPSTTKMALQICTVSHNQLSNYLAYHDDGWTIETKGYTTMSHYGDRLKIVLDKPFDESEYDRLMSLATARKPKTKLRHLRNMSKTVTTAELGHSYLDYFPQLAKMVRHADHHEGLTILRGFFYWLENVGHDGAFKPWEGPSSSYQPVVVT